MSWVTRDGFVRKRPMKRSAVRVCALVIGGVAGWALVPACAWAFGDSLDAMYRDNVRAENNGELPSYLYATVPPPIPQPKPLTPEDILTKLRAETPSIVVPDSAPPIAWPDVVKQIGSGAPGAFAVDAVRRKAEAADPQAVELFAWMNATGTGVRRDLTQAFNLYMQADGLNVAGAKENAKAIYNALPPSEKKSALNPNQ